MATRSFIGKLQSDGSVIGIYCHWDGGPDHNGKLLDEHYLDLEKVDRLLMLGDISFLDKEIGEPHSFDNPTKGWTVAYCRDRGDEFEPNRLFRNVDDLLGNASDLMGAEYAYIFDGEVWTHYEV